MLRFLIYKTWQTTIQLYMVAILLVATRPEGFFYAFGTMLAVLLLFLADLVMDRSKLRRLMLVIGATCATFLALILLRYTLYGAIWPNPVYSKVGFSESILRDGLNYWVSFHNDGIFGSMYAFATLLALVILGTQVLGRCKLVKGDMPGAVIKLLTIASVILILVEIFIILAGGNWMGYFRFFAPILFLKNIILLISIYLFTVYLTKIRRFLMIAISAFIFFSFEQLRSKGYVDIWVGIASCSEKVSLNDLTTDISQLNNLIAGKNCAYKRDFEGILPFLQTDLPKIIRQVDRKIVFASYQAGFFPYKLRELYSERAIYFLDTVGLANLDIAQTKGRKNSIGHIDGTQIGKLYCGEAAELSDKVEAYKVDLIYALGASTDDIAKLAACNYAVIYERPGAVVFARKDLNILKRL